LSWAALATVAVVVGVALRITFGLERDEVLSHIGKTDVGKITPSWGLVGRLLGYVGLPLLSLLASRLPDHGILLTLAQNLSNAFER
jgi:hypothetical protein